MDMMFIPVIIQIKQKRRPGKDFGDLSPYLRNDEIFIKLFNSGAKLNYMQDVSNVI